MLVYLKVNAQIHLPPDGGYFTRKLAQLPQEFHVLTMEKPDSPTQFGPFPFKLNQDLLGNRTVA
ncbi:MAG: hypothetical protein CL897_05255 [Dehalococcoidia bacterium]|nr:hypothetical protein [Dehalococcoidia bacterium]HCV00263.1 hypothetical protein [Dehalococcoidia bacterium]